MASLSDREVILFNNAGVSSSSGEVPTSFERYGRQRHRLHRGAGSCKGRRTGLLDRRLGRAGNHLQAPDLVRRLILVGTGPRGGQGMANLTPEAQRIFGASYESARASLARRPIQPSEASQAAGRELPEAARIFGKRTAIPRSTTRCRPPRVEAMGKWGIQQRGPTTI